MKLIKWCSQHKWSCIIVILAFIIIPLLIEYIPLFFGQHLIQGDWLSFWGSYLGFLPAGLITYIVLEFQFKRQEGIDKKNVEEQLKKEKQEFLFEQDFSELTNIQSFAIDNYWLLKRFEESIDEGSKREWLKKEWDKVWSNTVPNRSKITIWYDGFSLSGRKIFVDDEDSISILLSKIGEEFDSFNRIIFSQPSYNVEMGDCMMLRESIENISDKYLKIYTILTKYKVEIKINTSA